MDPNLTSHRWSQLASLARVSWRLTSIPYTATEEPTMRRAAEKKVPPEKYAYFLASAKQVMETASSFGGPTAEQETLRMQLMRIWRDLTPDQVKLIEERARELGAGQVTLQAAWQATLEIAPPEVVNQSLAAVEDARRMGQEIHANTEAWSVYCAIVEAGVVEVDPVG